eukprot:TRINITY_DN18174_c0_g1_i2.p1 TRINITY_DN18174_c0_g1~~TRINITY_DN18174_c0_g1_i2.p1  ORF type:complete len:181 (-),score=48.42 TRINITY_DN18174_c0_g1_i2:70-612(-)
MALAASPGAELAERWREDAALVTDVGGACRKQGVHSSFFAVVAKSPSAVPLDAFYEVLLLGIPNAIFFAVFTLSEATSTAVLAATSVGADLGAGAALGGAVESNVAGHVLLGMVASLDTLVSQAAGAGRKDVACDYLQRCRLIMAMQLAWMLPTLLFARHLLLCLGYDVELASRPLSTPS